MFYIFKKIFILIFQGGPPQQGAVMMVYGLDPNTVNADRLFNLCCLYGNVVRVSIHMYFYESKFI